MALHFGAFHRSPAYFANVMTVGHRHYQAALERLEKEYPSRRSANDPLTYEEFAAQSDKRDFTRRLFRMLPRLAFNQNIL